VVRVVDVLVFCAIAGAARAIASTAPPADLISAVLLMDMSSPLWWDKVQ
jgi:hypothetical protein